MHRPSKASELLDELCRNAGPPKSRTTEPKVTPEQAHETMMNHKEYLVRERYMNPQDFIFASLNSSSDEPCGWRIEVLSTANPPSDALIIAGIPILIRREPQGKDGNET